MSSGIVSDAVLVVLSWMKPEFLPEFLGDRLEGTFIGISRRRDLRVQPGEEYGSIRYSPRVSERGRAEREDGV
jgi:hypothetical protein